VPDDIRDLYFDSYQLWLGPLGVTVSLGVGVPDDDNPGHAHEQKLVRLRMDKSTAKLLAYQLAKKVALQEADDGIEMPVSPKSLNACHIAPEDWETFWKRLREAQRMP
jgi:hypothetical protein